MKKYRVESVVYSDISREWSLLTEYTDNRDAASNMSNWLNGCGLIPHYGLVINQANGNVEYEFSTSHSREMLNRLWKHIDEVIIRKQKEEVTENGVNGKED